MSCKGICIQYKTGRNPDGSRYGNGTKRCKTCDIFIKYNDIFCPCCRSRLRISSHKKTSKEMLKSKK